MTPKQKYTALSKLDAKMDYLNIVLLILIDIGLAICVEYL